MNDRENMPLEELVGKVFDQLAADGFSEGTIGLYECYFGRLKKMASSLGKELYDRELADKFIQDDAYRNGRGEGHCHSRYLYHVRCVRFIESYINKGTVDWGIMHPLPANELKSEEFRLCLERFKAFLIEEGLKPNTIDGYFRFVFYFLSYLEDKGLASLSQVKSGDITFFMVLVCQEHYAPTSVGAHITGLRRFVHIFRELSAFESEIPEHLPKKIGITPSYTEEEHEKIDKCLTNSGISSRNRAIALIAFETGLRAVDICKLKIEDIDWPHDIIRIQQEKTGEPLTIPLQASVGNALMAYLLEERPSSDSPYVFLRAVAPFQPLVDHASIYSVLRKVLKEAAVELDGRISGSRMTRHSYASRMLRKGVPLPVISDALGHNSPNSTMRYLATDEKMMASCTLPLPKGVRHE